MSETSSAVVTRPPNLSEGIELALRDEIRKTQGAQSELMKWKLIAVAAIGAIGLGLPKVGGSSGATPGLRYQVLCLVPLLCLYADLVCLHYMLRIITIGAFIKESYRKFREIAPRLSGIEHPLLDYEGFVFRTRLGNVKNSATSRKWFRRVLDLCASGSPFNLELWAIVGSSFVINVGLFLLPLILDELGLQTPDHRLVLFSQSFWFVGIMIIAWQYRKRKRQIAELEIEDRNLGDATGQVQP